MREVLTYLADTAANAREANPSCPTVPTHVLCRAVDRLEAALRSGAGQGEGGGGWEPRCERCDHQRTVHAGDSGPCDASMCSCLEFQPSPAPEPRR